MTSPLCLTDLAVHDRAVVERVLDARPDDPIAARLRDLGFVAGEPLRLAARGPFGGNPVLIAIGGTRFALRRGEAARVIVRREGVHD
ncbi:MULTISPECIES: FeoA family protein [unclassified Bordetella]|uniref:FeoA family protein n=1 Tax=unclassified Bordetella TaxID=2630031 RepID=UPI001321EF2C|nr:MULTISPECIES: FeoA family protein [unclassified Bordetella]MVW70939.1 ferrous iron transport protein A [Bordetella sp. 15P40C-2]MVW79464.1 ferrous iron transport protein A [Bordetella sp. 02P26C-1]